MGVAEIRTSEFKKKHICFCGFKDINSTIKQILNHRNIIWYVSRFKNFVNDSFIDINVIKNLPNIFLRRISEIITSKNLILHTFFKNAGCPRGRGVIKFGQ